MISLLTGPAADWATPLLAANDPVLNSLPEFINLFRRQFDDPDRERTAEARLKNFEQGQRSCADYATEFLRLSADTDWNDGAKIFIFKSGLSSDIKTRLSYISACPRDLRGFIDLCIRVDERITELQKEVPPFKPSKRLPSLTTFQPQSSNDMQVDAVVRGPLSTQEKERRRQLGLCLYCGQPGHRAHDCPNRRSNRRTTAGSRSVVRQTNTSASISDNSGNELSRR
ncbi:Retrotransposon-derived protein peg10 [Batrachochytrium dendrobatidis]|nr:Retrotransposon-derived protein peg10 [Batrachochytrium dendrobatidis]